MPNIRTAKEVLEKCNVNGNIVPIAIVDYDNITSLLELADGDIQAAQKLMKDLPEKSILWNNVMNSYYDALHKLVDAYLRFDKITSLNHICLFAYLCEKHRELDVLWDFFEKIRTKRNGIHYYGQKTTKKDFFEIKLQAEIYVNVLKKAVLEKLK